MFAQTCSGVCSNLVSSPSNYDNAYFEVQSLRVYGTSSEVETHPKSSGAGHVRAASVLGLAGSTAGLLTALAVLLFSSASQTPLGSCRTEECGGMLRDTHRF
ncbi:hypothetical protein BC834DRAFT_877689 [Gloeopeniophorella convolvens]|nr:hypothetical protein BC834DRAFT_877689 [Gloeopeniophorella convolvens]